MTVEALLLVICACVACAIMIGHLVGELPHFTVPVIAVLVNALGVLANMSIVKDFMDSAGEEIGVFPAGMISMVAITLWIVATGLVLPHLLTRTQKLRDMQKA
jgi:Na+/proline symporter